MSRKYPWEAALIGCPFYLVSDKKSILCEGYASGVNVESHFKRAEQKESFVQEYCFAGYKDCPVYCNAMKKYD